MKIIQSESVSRYFMYLVNIVSEYLRNLESILKLFVKMTTAKEFLI